MGEKITLEASCSAAAIAALEAHEFAAGETIVALLEPGQAAPWALLEVDDMAGARSIFPLYSNGVRGDADRRQGHMGVCWWQGSDRSAHTLRVVANRSARMIRSEVAR